MTNRGKFMSIGSPMSINMLKSRRHLFQKDIILVLKKRETDIQKIQQKRKTKLKS